MVTGCDDVFWQRLVIMEVKVMKVQALHLRNFKRFDSFHLDFRDPETGLAEDLIVLTGRNGSGKSSVLQTLSAMLGVATYRLSSPAELDWPGFDLGLANKAWARPTGIEVEVEFSKDLILPDSVVKLERRPWRPLPAGSATNSRGRYSR
jgi:predicted ATP-dependent endonuclease of OLD family